MIFIYLHSSNYGTNKGHRIMGLRCNDCWRTFIEKVSWINGVSGEGMRERDGGETNNEEQNEE